MKAIVGLLAGVAVVSGFVVSAAGAPERAAAQDAKKIEAGMKVYATQKCIACHAIEGKGMKAYPLDGVGTRLSVEDIRKWIVNPDEMAAKFETKAKLKMKAYKLDPADLDSLVAYMVSLKKKLDSWTLT